MDFGKVRTEWMLSRMSGTAKSLRNCTLHVGGSALQGQRRKNKFEYPNDKGCLSLCVYKLFFIFRGEGEHRVSNETELISFQSASRGDEAWWTDT